MTRGGITVTPFTSVTVDQPSVPGGFTLKVSPFGLGDFKSAIQLKSGELFDIKWTTEALKTAGFTCSALATVMPWGDWTTTAVQANESDGQITGMPTTGVGGVTTGTYTFTITCTKGAVEQIRTADIQIKKATIRET